MHAFEKRLGEIEEVEEREREEVGVSCFCECCLCCVWREMVNTCGSFI